jgi:hypothetical protein
VCSSTEAREYFNKYDAGYITSFGVPYDYDSVMHYGPCAYSNNGLKTIVPKVSQKLYLFMVSNCEFLGGFVVLQPRHNIKHKKIVNKGR